METQATLKNARLSPRKARLVARNVVGVPADKAMDILQFSPQKAARVIRQVMYSALSNADTFGIDKDTLVVKQIIVNQGPSWKRFLPRAQGRATQIIKRTSHITVILAEN